MPSVKKEAIIPGSSEPSLLLAERMHPKLMEEVSITHLYRGNGSASLAVVIIEIGMACVRVKVGAPVSYHTVPQLAQAPGSAHGWSIAHHAWHSVQGSLRVQTSIAGLPVDSWFTRTSMRP